jgi:hypothetical protein
MNSNGAYIDAALDLSKRCIRLVEILDKDPLDSVHCLLKSFPLSTCPSYTALSYTWGSPPDTQEITVNGNSFPVRENLARFLEQMRLDRKGKGWRYFWIDAICIDQSNISERNHQVGLMKQIYSQVGFRRCPY